MAAAVSGVDLFDVGAVAWVLLDVGAVARVVATDAGWCGHGARGRGGGLGCRPCGWPRAVAVTDLVATGFCWSKRRTSCTQLTTETQTNNSNFT